MKSDNQFVRKFIARYEKIEKQAVERFLLHLHDEKNFLAELVNLLHEGLLVIDRDKRILLVNSYTRKLIKFSYENPVGKPIEKCIKNERLLVFINKVIELNEESIQTEISLNIPSERVLNVTIINYDIDHETQYKVFVFSDITDRKIKFETLLQNEKINTFNLLSAGVAHEIGNPLNSLGINLQILQKELKSHPNSSVRNLLELVDIARDEVDRLDSIIKRFLKSIRPYNLKLTENNIREMLDNLLRLMMPELKHFDITTEIKQRTKIPNFLFDVDQINQAIRNLLQNAIQVMPDGGKIICKLAIQDEYCVLSITDTGPGIPKELRQKIFDPYFTTRPEGSGLGLMVVSRIIAAHGGEISFVSKEKKGTTVIIKLPMLKHSKKYLPHTPETP